MIRSSEGSVGLIIGRIDGTSNPTTTTKLGANGGRIGRIFKTQRLVRRRGRRVDNVRELAGCMRTTWRKRKIRTGFPQSDLQECVYTIGDDVQSLALFCRERKIMRSRWGKGGSVRRQRCVMVGERERTDGSVAWGGVGSGREGGSGWGHDERSVAFAGTPVDLDAWADCASGAGSGGNVADFDKGSCDICGRNSVE